ncbi:hypothetical protein IWQ60_000025 [Tieghemiomyces parasiticus]|uniref:Uncharacterized protein n=1 Tax=Tieghemiomyces parasiticus TaxID=78921 RepID=A0A9W8E3U1_9FUNG|nr:hypothetical protein IWQ60_000025 [Tieghemiomyces parasiticus]
MYVAAVPSNPRLRHYTIDDRFPMHRFKQERASLTLYPAEDAELRAHYEAQIYGKGLSKIANNLSVYQALRNRSLNRDSKGFIRSCAITPRVENKEQIVAYYETDLESGIRVRIIYDPRDPDFNIQGQLDAIGPVIFLTTFGYLFNGSGRMLLYKNLRFIQELNGNRQPESQLPDLLASLDEIKRIYENRPHSLSKSAYKKKYRSRNP